MTGADVHAVREFEGEFQGDRVRLREGMPVRTRRDESLGRVSSVLVEEHTNMGEFVVLEREQEGRRVLLPAVAFDEVREGALVARIRREDADRLPGYVENRNPTPEEIRQAHSAVGADVDRF